MATQRDNGSDLSPRKVAERLKEEGKQRLERGKSTAAEQVEHVANALRSAGGEFGGQSAIGSYTNQLADSVDRFGARLREGSIESLASDLQAAARRNPTAFVLGGLALGIVLARIVKASTPEHTYEDSALLAGGSLDRPAQPSASEAPTIDIGGDGGAGTPDTSSRFGG